METTTGTVQNPMKTNSYYNYFMPWKCVECLLGLRKQVVPLVQTAGAVTKPDLAPDSDNQCSPYFVVLQQQDEAGSDERRKFVVDFSSLEPIRMACTKQRSRVALHWGSVTHRLFGIDLDADLLGKAYVKCRARHKDPAAAFCSRCWWQLQCAAYATKLALCAVVNASLYNPDLETSGLLGPITQRTVMTPEDVMATFSGSGGIHLWVHPGVGVHNLSQRQRQQIIDDLMVHWIDYVHEQFADALRAARAWIMVPDVTQSEPTRAGILPIDRGASSAGESWRELRLPFSPHLGNPAAYVNTPFELEDPTATDERTALPRHWAIRWFDTEFPRPKRAPPGYPSTVPSASLAHIKAWRSTNAANVENAVKVFNKWWSCRSTERS
jgi:hypothetical protein